MSAPVEVPVVRTAPARPDARRGLAVTLLCALPLATGCSSPEGDSPSKTSPPQQSTWATETDVQERCLSLAPEAPLEPISIDDAGVASPGVLMSPDAGASVGVVLLPQIGPGLCGWLPYADYLRQRGMAALSVDLCGYGESTCDPDLATNPQPQVDAAARWLRAEVGVREVVVVGASMGGSQTVRAVAAGASVDRWVDVSGPSAWDGVALLDVADQITRPGLVIRAERDGSKAEFGRAQTLAASADADFLKADGGHGWDLLTNLEKRPTRLGEAVADFAAND